MHPQVNSYFCHVKFSSVPGHLEIKERLIRSAQEEKVSHALLFAGNPGYGTLPLATAFATYLNCENPGDTDSCGKCPSCIKNEKLVHPDVHYVFPIITSKEKPKDPKCVDFLPEFREAYLEDPYLSINDWVDFLTGGEAKNKQGNIPVEEANDLIRRLSLKSFEGKYKVVVLWMPENLHPSSANKLLKSIEEPPDQTIFLLVTSERDRILPTILSRTQLIRLKRLEPEDILSSLISAGEISEGHAVSISKISDGDIRNARELAEVSGGGESAETAFLEWMRLCFNPGKTMDKLLAWVDAMAANNRDSQKQFLVSALRVVRECIVLNLSAVSLARIEPAQQEKLERFRNFITVSNMEAFADELNKGCFHLERNASPKILFLDLSLKVSTILQKK